MAALLESFRARLPLMWHTLLVRVTGHAAYALGIATAVWASAAHAETDPCAKALDVARQLRNAGAIHQALSALGDCSACPSATEVCDATKISLRSAMPSVLVVARDPEGRDLPDAKTVIDDTPATQDRAVELDPGSHHVRVEAIGRVVSEQTVTLEEHDHLRLEVILGRALSPPPKAISTRPVPASVWAFGASGLVALATSGVLWAIAWHEQTDATNTLNNSQYSIHYRYDLANAQLGNEHALLIAGDAVLVVGAVALVTTAVLYFVRPTRRVTLGATSVSLTF